jgi:hypothetical protein
VPARGLEVEVPRAVVVERVWVVVSRAAVGLDDEAPVRLCEVDTVHGAVTVHDRGGQAGSRDQLQETSLELAAGERQVIEETPEQPAEAADAPAPVCACEGGGHSVSPEKAKREGLLDRPLGLGRRAARDVDDRPFDAGAWDAPRLRDVRARQRPRGVHPDPGPAVTRAPGHRDLDGPSPRI